jgi:glycine/D-amino acid oxidase-like deaminating enzyme
VIYHDGIYIVPHSADVVAVGSTSEREWTHTEVDPENTSYLQTAAAFCPALQGAEVISHWAGVRPRARKRDPMLGQIEGKNRLYVMTGGFKISFGIAHRLAVVMADMVLEQPLSLELPESFTLQHHLG